MAAKHLLSLGDLFICVCAMCVLSSRQRRFWPICITEIHFSQANTAIPLASRPLRLPRINLWRGESSLRRSRQVRSSLYSAKDMLTTATYPVGGYYNGVRECGTHSHTCEWAWIVAQKFYTWAPAKARFLRFMDELLCARI